MKKIRTGLRRAKVQLRNQTSVSPDDLAKIFQTMLANPAAALAYDLRHFADQDWELAEASADKVGITVRAQTLEAFADEVKQLGPNLLKRFAAAREMETRFLRYGGPDTIFLSMICKIELLHLQTLEDLCLIYIRAVEIARRDARWSDPAADMNEFWKEFPKVDQ